MTEFISEWPHNNTFPPQIDVIAVMSRPKREGGRQGGREGGREGKQQSKVNLFALYIKNKKNVLHRKQC